MSARPIVVGFVTLEQVMLHQRTLHLSRKTWLFVTPFDLTRYDGTASKSRVIMSGHVRRCKKVVKRLEEPGFPATYTCNIIAFSVAYVVSPSQ